MRHAIIAVLAALLLAALAGTAVAGPFEDGESAYERGDYATAVREFRVLAAQGHAIAQYSLGVMYSKGQGVPQDYAKAAKWYRRAAEQGDAPAQYNLGVMYNEGKGVPQDHVQAANLYRKAAAQGVAVAQNALGKMYYGGEGVPQDHVQALMWFNLAGAQGHALAAMTRDLLVLLMTPAQIAEAQKVAADVPTQRMAAEAPLEARPSVAGLIRGSEESMMFIGGLAYGIAYSNVNLYLRTGQRIYCPPDDTPLVNGRIIWELLDKALTGPHDPNIIATAAVTELQILYPCK